MIENPWLLDPNVTFLNHGSFGACPRPVLDTQQRWRERMEREPVRFLATELEEIMDATRQELSVFLGADAGNLAFIPNTTTGINAVLRSLKLSPGDELLVTTHEYNACANAARYAAETAGAKVQVVDIPFPVSDSHAFSSRIMAAAGPRTRLLLVDHVTSATGLILPLAGLIREMDERGIDTLVDGAHAPGMLALNLDALGAAYYVGNLHKWVCAPKGAAFLCVRPDRQAGVRPLAISHGANACREERSLFRLEFDWMGTFDPSAYLAVPAALKFMQSMHPQGWPGLMAANRKLALEARTILCDALGCAPPAPDSMIGALVSLPLPDSSGPPSTSQLYQDPLQSLLLQKAGIQVPVVPWPEPPHRLLRISAQIYNTIDDYIHLSRVLPPLLACERPA